MTCSLAAVAEQLVDPHQCCATGNRDKYSTG
jgi:hypothetical protein